MSRIGNAPIEIPSGVSIDISADNLVTVKGPKGELKQQIDSSIELTLEDGVLTLARSSEQKRVKSLHGLYRSLLSNMVQGASKSFVKELELVGVGYRASNSGQLLELSLGYSHPIMFYVPDEIKVETKMERGSNPSITLECPDNQLVGAVAAKIRSFRQPEPYKGKGVRYKGESIRRKAGKTAAK